MRAFVALFALAGCGRLDFDELEPTASVPAAIASLAAPQATDGHPSVTADLRELYFASNRPGGGGGFDIWRATRDRASDPWGAPRPVVELNTRDDEATVHVSLDGRTLWITSDRSGGLGGYDIYVATRQAGAPWSAPVLDAELSSNQDDAAAAPDPSGLAIVFHSKRPGGKGARDLWLATRGDTAAPWQEPVPLASLNTDEQDADPFITADGLHLMFDSDRGPGPYRDLQIASRARTDQPFGPPVAIPDLDSEQSDADPWLSPDGLYMVFSTSRTGDDEIFEVVFDSPRF